MSKRITQAARNLAKELFQTSSILGAFGQSIIMKDVPLFTVDELKDLEDKLFGALLEVRQVRHMMTATVIHEKGQRA
jgi:hypothetical protein